MNLISGFDLAPPSLRQCGYLWAGKCGLAACAADLGRALPHGAPPGSRRYRFKPANCLNELMAANASGRAVAPP